MDYFINVYEVNQSI